MTSEGEGRRATARGAPGSLTPHRLYAQGAHPLQRRGEHAPRQLEGLWRRSTFRVRAKTARRWRPPEAMRPRPMQTDIHPDYHFVTVRLADGTE
ncbi:MAG: hypothetical protein AAFQ43_07190, partial [Bacteroidota bacterium]